MFAKYWLTLKAGLFFFSPWHPTWKIWPWIIIYLLAFSTRRRRVLGHRLAACGRHRWTLVQLISEKMFGRRALRGMDYAEWSGRGPLLDALGESANFLSSCFHSRMASWLFGKLGKISFCWNWLGCLESLWPQREKLVFSGWSFDLRRRERMIGNPVFRSIHLQWDGVSKEETKLGVDIKSFIT